MKNIKVNITNQDGKRSSTTLNFVLCEKYYKHFSSLEGGELIHETKMDYAKAIAGCAQFYTNYLVSKAVKDGYKGINQYLIEMNMLEEILDSVRSSFLKR